MKIRRKILSVSIITPVVLATFTIAELCRAENSLGITVQTGINTGTLNKTATTVIPSLEWNISQANGSGWQVGIDFNVASPRLTTGISKAERTGLWVLRTANTPIFQLPLRFSGGMGWGLWRYRLSGGKSIRGTLGFQCGIEYQFRRTDLSKFRLGVGYSGMNVPGTGLFDDIYYLKMTYRLLLFD